MTPSWRRLQPDDLVNTSGIAWQAGVSKAAVSIWRTRHADFPEPLPTPGVLGVPLWAWRDVEAWLIRTGRLS